MTAPSSQLTPMRDALARRAFTLVEMLVVVVIIGILCVLALVSVQKVVGAADSVKCASNLRSVGLAINLYVNDNNFPHPAMLPSWMPSQGQLPGPLNGGQIPVSSKKYQSMLAYLLYPYLGLPEPGNGDLIVPILQCPAWKKQTTKLDGVSYLAPNIIVYQGQTNKSQPFGYPANGTNPVVLPMRIVALPPVPLSEIMVLQDVDKMNVSAGPDWYPPLPPKPVHNGKRNTLYLDGHVGTQ